MKFFRNKYMCFFLKEKLKLLDLWGLGRQLLDSNTINKRTKRRKFKHNKNSEVFINLKLNMKPQYHMAAPLK